jgi:Caudovirus prohead serine protease
MEGKRKPDFSGWATKVGLRCSDGRTIMPDAFKHQDQVQVPLVWQHNHNDPSNVLGHVLLENRAEGVYAYGFFNDTDPAKQAKTLVEHEDISSLSIYANQLTEKAKQVLHGFIREVSLVLSGANPGALIDNITLAHADGDMVTLEDEAIIYTGEELQHDEDTADDGDPAGEAKHEDAGDDSGDEDAPSVKQVYEAMSEEQKNVVHFMVGAALEDAAANHSSEDISHGEGGSDDEKEGRRMKRNVFEQQDGTDGVKKTALSHSDLKGIVDEAQKIGSLKAAFEGYALEHGIDSIELLFPDAKNVTTTPEWDTRRLEWVKSVLNGTRKSPFSRIKSMVADLTFEAARAKGYIKGNLKKEEFFGVAKRTTTPTTIYKKQKLDRDDIIDITDFDVVAWLKGEMRLMMDEELARAILIGDGRDVADEDKIRDPMAATDGAGIRSIANEHDLYAATINVNIDDTNSTPTELVDAIIRSMTYYKGSGTPTLYTTLPTLTYMLLERDQFGHRLWKNASELASEMNVASIVTVEVMEDEPDLVGIIVNLSDYTVGADRGGELNFFDDFDIDYNQYKYLFETRLSGALTKLRSAVVVKRAPTNAAPVVPTAPSFDGSSITIPTVTHVVYKDRADDSTLTGSVAVAEDETVTVYAVADSGYYFANNVDDEWSFTNRG